MQKIRYEGVCGILLLGKVISDYSVSNLPVGGIMTQR